MTFQLIWTDYCYFLFLVFFNRAFAPTSAHLYRFTEKLPACSNSIYIYRDSWLCNFSFETVNLGQKNRKIATRPSKLEDQLQVITPTPFEFEPWLQSQRRRCLVMHPVFSFVAALVLRSLISITRLWRCGECLKTGCYGLLLFFMFRDLERFLASSPFFLLHFFFSYFFFFIFSAMFPFIVYLSKLSAFKFTKLESSAKKCSYSTKICQHGLINIHSLYSARRWFIDPTLWLSRRGSHTKSYSPPPK